MTSSLLGVRSYKFVAGADCGWLVAVLLNDKIRGPLDAGVVDCLKFQSQQILKFSAGRFLPYPGAVPGILVLPKSSRIYSL